MSIVITEPQKMTVQQRSQQNAERIASELGLDNPKIVSAAVLEAALKEIGQNKEFAQLVQQTFTQMAPPKTKPRVASNSKAKGGIYKTTLVPIGTVEGHRIDLGAAPDPFFLAKLYGMHQLHDALDEYSGTELKRSIAEQMALHPNTKPKTKTKKEDIIAYLIDLVKQSEGTK
jgi:hypothetical protein